MRHDLALRDPCDFRDSLAFQLVGVHRGWVAFQEASQTLDFVSEEAAADVVLVVVADERPRHLYAVLLCRVE